MREREESHRRKILCYIHLSFKTKAPSQLSCKRYCRVIKSEERKRELRMEEERKREEHFKDTEKKRLKIEKEINKYKVRESKKEREKGR